MNTASPVASVDDFYWNVQFAKGGKLQNRYLVWMWAWLSSNYMTNATELSLYIYSRIAKLKNVVKLFCKCYVRRGKSLLARIYVCNLELTFPQLRTAWRILISGLNLLHWPASWAGTQGACLPPRLAFLARSGRCTPYMVQQVQVWESPDTSPLPTTTCRVSAYLTLPT